MDLENLINEIKSIILRHAKPERIWLYGSRAIGEATESSDIDIAFSDKEFHQYGLIEDDLDKLPTLLKIDVKNIATAEERFRQRVIATGRVLYSANKQLRFEDGLYNFRRAFERYAEALDRKSALEREGFGDIFLDLAVKRFEFTYEMSWKAIKRYLDYAGISALSPRANFKEAFSQHLITDERIWLEMIERRNLSSHVYSQDEVAGILGRLDDYRKAFHELLERLEAKSEG
jgi:nucleotidyltransferase substrate binding protein (TIGR01987 family)